MTASPTPFFAKPANKSDGEHYAGNASCSDHIGDANKMVAPDHSPDADKMVSAAMPSEEEIDRIVTGLYRRFKGWSKRGFSADDVTWCEVKADVLALFAPILAEKERREAAHNIVRETFAYHVAESVDGLCKIPRRVADDMAQSYASLEARALAAEAALAAERERVGQLVRLLDQQMGTPCEQIRYQQDIDNLRAVTTEAIDEIESWGAYASEYFRDKHDLTGTVSGLRARAAAIRAK